MKRFFIYFILIIILFTTFDCNVFASTILENSTIEVHSVVQEPNINDLQLYSNCVFMIEQNTGDVLYAKNAYEKMYPASTTKMLSAIIILENCNLDEIATVSSAALKAVPPTYSTANLKVRRTISCRRFIVCYASSFS